MIILQIKIIFCNCIVVCTSWKKIRKENIFTKGMCDVTSLNANKLKVYMGLGKEITSRISGPAREYNHLIPINVNEPFTRSF